MTNKLVFKGNIAWITDEKVCVRLRASQQNTAVLPSDSRYAIEHDYMDTSFRSMYQGLAAFLSATQERRDLLLGQRQPRYEVSWDAAIASAQDDFTRIALKARAAQDYLALRVPVKLLGLCVRWWKISIGRVSRFCCFLIQTELWMKSVRC